MLHFGLEAIALADSFRAECGESVRIRVGVEVGKVFGGVISRRVPRYCLFGDTVNVASRHCSHGKPGRLQVGAGVKASLERSGSSTFAWHDRGLLPIKGKGDLRAFEVDLEPAPRGQFSHSDVDTNDGGGNAVGGHAGNGTHGGGSNGRKGGDTMAAVRPRRPAARRQGARLRRLRKSRTLTIAAAESDAADGAAEQAHFLPHMMHAARAPAVR